MAATVFGVLAGPKIVADQHELMCGWSSGWQRFAGWLSDCVAYAERPTQVVVPMDLTGLSGPKTKSQIRAEKNAFDHRRFLDAVKDNDTAELDLLHKEGFRFSSAQACELLGSPGMPNIVVALERFAKERIACKAVELRDGQVHEATRDAPTETLLRMYHKRALMFNTMFDANACWHNPDPDSLSQIDEWIKIRPSEDLRIISRHLIKAYEIAERASPDQLKQMCRDRYAREGRSTFSIFRTKNKDDFADAVFSFSSSCEKVGRLTSEGHWLEMRMSESISQRNGARPMSMEDRIARECGWLTEKTGIHPKAAYMKEYLMRWSK